MQKGRPIRTRADYAAALARIDRLMDAERGSPDGEELDDLVDLVERYESKHEPMGSPSPAAVVRFPVESRGVGWSDAT